MYSGNPSVVSPMPEDKRKIQLLELFTNITSKTKIVEPMKKIHGSLRDRDAVEREIALVMREILDQGFFKTKLKPIQLARLVSAYYLGKNDTEIARELGMKSSRRPLQGPVCASNCSGTLTSRCRSTGRRWKR